MLMIQYLSTSLFFDSLSVMSLNGVAVVMTPIVQPINQVGIMYICKLILLFSLFFSSLLLCTFIRRTYVISSRACFDSKLS